MAIIRLIIYMIMIIRIVILKWITSSFLYQKWKSVIKKNLWNSTLAPRYRARNISFWAGISGTDNEVLV